MKPARSADILPTAGLLDTRVALMLEGRVVDLMASGISHGMLQRTLIRFVLNQRWLPAP